MDFVRTDIPGFDELLGGGFPRGGNTLVTGVPGTGKTIFALQFIYNGATTFNEKGLVVTFEENAASLKKQAQQFGWNFDLLEKQGKVKILDIPVSDIKESTVREIIKIVERDNYSRLVIDSLSALAINTPNTFGSVTDVTEIFIKRFIYHFINELRTSGATSLLISQAAEGQLSSDGVSEFVSDGIIYIKHESLGGDFSRHLIIRKMRKVKNDEDIHPMEISKNGIVIHNLK